MDDFTATMIAEGQWDLAGKEPSEELAQEAWQHLVDTGLAWTLQGWFGRRAKELIDAGTDPRARGTRQLKGTAKCPTPNAT